MGRSYVTFWCLLQCFTFSLKGVHADIFPAQNNCFCRIYLIFLLPKCVDLMAAFNYCSRYIIDVVNKLLASVDCVHFYFFSQNKNRKVVAERWTNMINVCFVFVFYFLKKVISGSYMFYSSDLEFSIIIAHMMSSSLKIWLCETNFALLLVVFSKTKNLYNIVPFFFFWCSYNLPSINLLNPGLCIYFTSV